MRYEWTPQKPFSKVFLGSAGKQTPHHVWSTHCTKSEWLSPLPGASPCPDCAGQPDCHCLGSNGTLLSLHPSLLCKSNIIIGKWQINHLASMHTISHWFRLSLRSRAGKWRLLASLEAKVCTSSHSILLLKTPWPWYSPGSQGCYFGYKGTRKQAEMPVLKKKRYKIKGYMFNLRPGTLACLRAKSHKSCPTVRNPVDCSPPGSSVHGILQAGIVEWVAMSSSRGSSQPIGRTHVSCLQHWQAGSLPPSGKLPRYPCCCCCCC